MFMSFPPREEAFIKWVSLCEEAAREEAVGRMYLRMTGRMTERKKEREKERRKERMTDRMTERTSLVQQQQQQQQQQQVCFQHNTHYTEHCQARKPPCRYFTSRLFASLRFSSLLYNVR